jgi:RNA polymerase sigma-70 factor (ECF subfamily)
MLNRRHINNHPAQDFTLFSTDEEHLQKLSSDAREMLELATLDGLAYGTIADLMGVKIGTVKSRINRARVKVLEMRAASKTVAIVQAEAAHG